MDLEQARNDICTVGKLLYDRKLLVAGDGNLSVRVGPNEILVTPSGACKGRLEPGMLVRCSLDGAVLPDDQSGRHPSSELAMHLRVYRERPDLAAVVHAHPPAATAFAVCRKPIEDSYLPETAVRLGTVPVCDFALPSTPAVADSLAPYLAGHQAVLLANHGALAWGRNIWEAFDLMETLEFSADVQARTNALGGGVALSSEERAQVRSLRDRYAQAATVEPHCTAMQEAQASGNTCDNQGRQGSPHECP